MQNMTDIDPISFLTWRYYGNLQFVVALYYIKQSYTPKTLRKVNFLQRNLQLKKLATFQVASTSLPFRFKEIVPSTFFTVLLGLYVAFFSDSVVVMVFLRKVRIIGKTYIGKTYTIKS